MADVSLPTILSVVSASVVVLGVAWTIFKDWRADRAAKRLAQDGRVEARTVARNHDDSLQRAIEALTKEMGRLASSFDAHDRECIGFKAALTEAIKAMQLTLDRHDRLIEGHTSQIRANMTGSGNAALTVRTPGLNDQ